MAKLTDINKNDSYKVPEDYFESFSDQIQTRISEERLKEKYGNKNPFIVPENYFKNFTADIKHKQKSSGKLIQLLKPYLSIAAGILLIFGIWQLILTKIDNNKNITHIIDTINENNTDFFSNNTLNFDDIVVSEINEELDIYINETDATLLIEYTEENTDNFEINVSTEDIYDYLIDYADYADYDEILASL